MCVSVVWVPTADSADESQPIRLAISSRDRFAPLASARRSVSVKMSSRTLPVPSTLPLTSEAVPVRPTLDLRPDVDVSMVLVSNPEVDAAAAASSSSMSCRLDFLFTNLDTEDINARRLAFFRSLSC